MLIRYASILILFRTILFSYLFSWYLDTLLQAQWGKLITRKNKSITSRRDSPHSLLIFWIVSSFFNISSLRKKWNNLIHRFWAFYSFFFPWRKKEAKKSRTNANSKSEPRTYHASSCSVCSSHRSFTSKRCNIEQVRLQVWFTQKVLRKQSQVENWFQ